MSSVSYVVAAYAVTWIVILAYALVLRASARRVSGSNS